VLACPLDYSCIGVSAFVTVCGVVLALSRDEGKLAFALDD